MAVEKRPKQISNITERANEVFDSMNLNKQPVAKENMKQYSVKLRPEEKMEFDKMFETLGLNNFSTGVRFALAEFKRNHL